MRDRCFESSAHTLYQSIRKQLVANPEPIIAAEQGIADLLERVLQTSIGEVVRDYDAASTLYPFWRNYPPMERGRAPRGDQFPWIEVGEHAVGTKFAHLLRSEVEVQDTSFPTGADQRFVLSDESISDWTDEITDTVWLFLDVKTVGPRDDFDHAVMSHNQVSGSGEWVSPETGVQNSVMTAIGEQASHKVYPALPPLVVLPDLTVAPVLTMAIKPVYSMERDGGEWGGQPLDRLELVSIPNGLLLTQNPNYLSRYPGLLYPGKDDKGKKREKLRARVDFCILRTIATWRHRRIWSRL
jgi:hypothetical protein